MEIRPAGFFIQPNLFWFVAVSRGLISNKNIPEQFGIVLIMSPRAKRNFDPFVLLQDSSFRVEKLDTDLLRLKQKHSDGYYEEHKCVWFYQVLPMPTLFTTLSTDLLLFYKEHFQKLIVKLNSFNKDYVVSQVLKKERKNTFHQNLFNFFQ